MKLKTDKIDNIEKLLIPSYANKENSRHNRVTVYNPFAEASPHLSEEKSNKLSTISFAGLACIKDSVGLNYYKNIMAISEMKRNYIQELIKPPYKKNEYENERSRSFRGYNMFIERFINSTTISSEITEFINVKNKLMDTIDDAFYDLFHLGNVSSVFYFNEEFNYEILKNKWNSYSDVNKLNLDTSFFEDILDKNKSTHQLSFEICQKVNDFKEKIYSIRSYAKTVDREFSKMLTRSNFPNKITELMFVSPNHLMHENRKYGTQEKTYRQGLSFSEHFFGGCDSLFMNVDNRYDDCKGNFSSALIDYATSEECLNTLDKSYFSPEKFKEVDNKINEVLKIVLEVKELVVFLSSPEVVDRVHTEIFNFDEKIEQFKLINKGCSSLYEELKDRVVNIGNEEEQKDLLKKEKDKMEAVHQKIIKDFQEEAKISIENALNKFEDFICFNATNMKGEYSDMILFQNDTILVKEKNSENYKIFVSIDEHVIIKNGIEAYLRYILRKNPSIQKLVVNNLSKSIDEKVATSLLYGSAYTEPLRLNGLFICLDTYFKNENILKSEGFDLMKKLELLKNKYEDIDDDMNSIIKTHKIHNYAHSIISNKYKDLYSKTTYKLFDQLLDMNVEKSVVQDLIGKKIASFKKTKDLNDHLKATIKGLNGFTLEMIKLKVISNDVEIISEKEGVLIVKINSFHQSKILGSSSWCISREEYYFKNYTERDMKQYFMYNFNLDPKITKSLVGVTLNSDNTVYVAHTKSDAHLNDKAVLDYLLGEVNKYENQELKEVESMDDNKEEQKLEYTVVNTQLEVKCEDGEVKKTITQEVPSSFFHY